MAARAAHPPGMPPLSRGRAEGRPGGRPAGEAERPRSPLRAVAAGAARRLGGGRAMEAARGYVGSVVR